MIRRDSEFNASRLQTMQIQRLFVIVPFIYDMGPLTTLRMSHICD